MINLSLKNLISYKIIFFGSESAGLRTLRFLIQQKNIEILSIISDEEGLSYSDFCLVAEENGIKMIKISNLSNKIKALEESKIKIDFVLSVFSPFIIDNEILDNSKYGGFNLHPGKLPEYAGFNPTSWSIYNNEKYHEVTFHKMTNYIDGGDIVFSKKFLISQDETALSLLVKSSIEGTNLVRIFFETISRKNIDDIILKKQDFTKRKYYSKTSKIPLLLDWNNSIELIDRIFRSIFFGPIESPLGYPYTMIDGKLVKLYNHKIRKCYHSRRVGDIKFISANEVEVACNDGLLNAKLL